jgi:hypothetical protein
MPPTEGQSIAMACCFCETPRNWGRGFGSCPRLLSGDDLCRRPVAYRERISRKLARDTDSAAARHFRIAMEQFPQWGIGTPIGEAAIAFGFAIAVHTYISGTYQTIADAALRNLSKKNCNLCQSPLCQATLRSLRNSLRPACRRHSAPQKSSQSSLNSALTGLFATIKSGDTSAVRHK